MKTLFLVLLILAFIVLSMEMLLEYIIFRKRAISFKENFSSLTNIVALGSISCIFYLIFFEKSFDFELLSLFIKICFIFALLFLILFIGYSSLNLFLYLMSRRNKIEKLKEFKLIVDYRKNPDKFFSEKENDTQEDFIFHDNFISSELCGKKVEVIAKFYKLDDNSDYDLVMNQVSKDGFHPATFIENLHFRIAHSALAEEFSIAFVMSVSSDIGDCYCCFFFVDDSFNSLIDVYFNLNFEKDKYLLAIKNHPIKYLS